MKMQNERFIVKYVPVKNCFVQLPGVWLRKLSTQIGAVKLSHNEKDFYLSISRSESSSNEFLCISATFGRCLRIKEGEEVSVSFIPDPPTLPSINVIPFNFSDWQIINLQAEKIQSILLDQINIVSPNQPIVIWLSKYLNVTLIIESISSHFMYGKLENYTEVYVQDVNEHKTSADTITNKITSHSTTRLNETDCEYYLKTHKYQRPPEIFRVCSISTEKKYARSEYDYDNETSSVHNVFMRSKQLWKLFPGRSNFSMTYGKIETVRKEESNLPFTLDSPKIHVKDSADIVVSLSIVEEFFNDEFFGKSDDSNIWISEGLQKELQVRLGSKIHVTPLNITDHSIDSIEIFRPPRSNSIDLKHCFYDYVKRYSTRTDLILASNSKIVLSSTKCRVVIYPKNIPYVLLNVEKIKELKIAVNEELMPEENSQTSLNDKKSEVKFDPERMYMKPMKNIVDDIMKILEMSLRSRDCTLDRENTIICGDTGTGKTAFLNLLNYKLQAPPNFVFTTIVDCKKLKGKKVDILSKFFTSTMHDCIHYQPSVLLLDNLECITSCASDEENSPDAINAMKISEFLSSLMVNFQSAHLIFVVATCGKIERLGKEMRSSRGVHLFQTIVKLPNITPEERIDFLKFNLETKVEISNKINWNTYCEKSEGWVFQDLVDLSEKSMFFSWKRNQNSLVLTDDDLSRAFEMIKPLSLYGVSLFNGEGYCWEDIGGLEDVKESLKQLLQWPLIYSGLFAKAPVRNQSGILLYGMPGTGKTMLAGAIAKECGINFISVKGPELLSKYIGASEEAVRSVFEKAQRIKPCIIFFDEFESLAPRRGHDSTGVTDRVVNQLLTHFDGVEGREGVAIVAASSRPDLLDPALLRPGRLDKSLLCPLPDEQTRAKILDTLCKRNSIDVNDLDFGVLSKITSGFTGADLGAVLTQARLDAVEELWENSSCISNSFEGVKITQEMLIQSVEATHPSLTIQEISKFNKIYMRFSKGDNFSEELLRNPKATLA